MQACQVSYSQICVSPSSGASGSGGFILVWQAQSGVIIFAAAKDGEN